MWLCALVTATIPLAGWLGCGESLLAVARHGHRHRFFVDVVTLLLAIAYWRMARATLHRGREGDPNSIRTLH